MMTETARGQGDANEAPAAKEPRYAIDPGVIEAQGRSPSLVVGDRLCEAAMAKLKSRDAWRTMSYAQLRQLARRNCAGQEGYLLPRQPLIETVFRMLLATREDELSLSAIHEELSELWVGSPWPRHIAAESLRRVLDASARYGIVPVPDD